MICVSIGRGRHKHMILEHQNLAEKGARLAELRLDFIYTDVNLKRLLDERPTEVVVTCRRERDGGRWTASEEKRLTLLRAAIVAGVEYVDLEEDIAANVPRYGKTKRVVSYHNFRETPENLEEIHERMAKLDPDVVKIACMAHRPHDCVRMLKMIKAKSKIVPTVGLCMGEIGIPTRILQGKFGAPFTYATFHHERALAPGQLSYEQMVKIYHYDQINEKTNVFGVIADPIAHSLSPLIHNIAFRELKLNSVYVPFRVPSEDLESFLKECQQLDIKGLSVTIPHKEAVLEHATRLDPAVEDIGAANTLIFDREQRIAYNTDYKAAMDSVDRAMTMQTAAASYRDAVALVLGAGGVSKAICYGLVRRGADVVVTSRTFARAKKLADELDCRAVEWSQRYKVKPNILVNGTPVGMHPNVDDTPFDGRYLNGSMVVFDTIYNPEQTLLIKHARQQNCVVVTGVDMFVGQASVQFELFTGLTAPHQTMRDELKRTIGPVKF
jgi:3-dehydroquinate dehydratase/shikimate dehydrogenase